MNKNFKNKLCWVIGIAITISMSSCLKDDFELNKCNTKTYLHNDPIDLVGQIGISMLNLTGFNGYESLLNTDSTKSVFPEIPSNITSKFNVSTTLVNGRKVVTISPKSGASGKLVLYIHGGAYVANAIQAHFDIIESTIDKTGATFIVPDYPLAPHYTYEVAYSLIQTIYDNLLATVGSQNIIIMGDSAGAGLSLGFTQSLKLNGQSLPNQVILLSPWLDINLTNPDIENIQDPILNAYGLRQAGLAWAGNSNPMFYKLSPINGTFEGLPRLSIFIGGRDIFLADVVKLRNMMSDKCLQLNVYEYPQMPHVWVGEKRLAAAKKALIQIAELINN
jgi:acetyl esterase/lipase